MTARTGKIARLPRAIREQLNCRLDDGEPGAKLVEWLNSLPEVQEVLKAGFGGRAISEQNLSEWRQGGFGDGQRQQQARDHVRRLTDQSEALDEATEETNVSDRLATVLAAELFKVMEQLLEKSGDEKEKLGYLREGLREVRFLRRGDCHAARLQMELERWERQCEREDEADFGEMEEKSKRRMIDLILAKFSEGTIAEAFGGGEHGRKIAELITRIKFDLPLSDPPKPAADARPQENAVPDGSAPAGAQNQTQSK